MKTSLIIAYHNEGMAFIQECVQSIKNTVKDLEHEIIIVDDCSDVPCEPISGTKLLRNPQNIGIGRTFDRGVEETNGENIILLACDIRFKDNNWAERLVNRITENPKSFICTKCVNYVDHDKWGTGASLYLRHDANVDPKRDKDFRDILNTSWLSIQGNTVAEIPCLLGAIYGVSREWYRYTEGWRGFRKWGTLEAYISLKSWLFGGKCLVDTSIDTYHIYKERHPHGTSVSDVISNKIKISRILRLTGFEEYLPDTEFINRAKAICDNDREQIEEMRRAYVPKIVFTIYEYAEKFGLKLPDNKESSKITPSYIKKECDAIYSKEESSYTKPYEKKIVINREAFFKTWNIDMRIEEESNTLSEEYNSIYANPKYHYQKHYTSSPYLNVWNKVASYINNEEKVIDVGCGPGQFMELLKDRGVKSYLGYDFSRTALEIARSKNLSPDYKVEYLDLYKMKPLPEADVYTLIEVLEHIKPDREVIDLIPGGKIIITVPNYLGGSHVRKFDTEEAVLERYIDLLKIKEITTINYGTGKIFVLFGIK